MTLCESVIHGETVIQGVVFYPGNSKGLLFSADRVFEFNPNTDVVRGVDAHGLHIRSEGVHVEKYFPGLYLKDGNSIFNVYGLFTNSSRNIFFILKNDAVKVSANDDIY